MLQWKFLPAALIAPAVFLMMLAAIVPGALVLCSSQVHAAGDTGTDTAAPPPRRCRPGWVWSTRYKRCVRRRSELIDDNDRYRYAVWLGKQGFYSESNGLLESMKNQNAPRVLTYRGYNHRHMGDWNKGLALYKQALARDPNYVLAREYLGEGYLKGGRIDLARLELAKIKTICGTRCEAYKDLAAEIAAVPSK